MAVLVGKNAHVAVGANTVGEQGTFTLSGFVRDTVESTSFGDDIKEYTFTQGDGGTVSFSGNYDPADTNGQNIIESACINASVFTANDLKFYINAISYICVTSGGTVMITKAKAISFEKAGIGTISFEGKVSGGYMRVINP